MGYLFSLTPKIMISFSDLKQLNKVQNEKHFTNYILLFKFIKL